MKRAKADTAGGTLPLDEPLQTRWTPRPGRGMCRRDPTAGPGTCSHWWDGCPKREERNCYQLWAGRMGAAGFTRISPCGTTYAADDPKAPRASTETAHG